MVGDDPVVACRAERSGIAEKVHLDRGGAQREDRNHLRAGEPVEIKQHVDAVVADRRRDCARIRRRHAAERIGGGLDPSRDVVVLPRVHRIHGDGEPRAVEPLEQADDQAAHRMVAEIGGHETEAQRAAARAVPAAGRLAGAAPGRASSSARHCAAAPDRRRSRRSRRRTAMLRADSRSAPPRR